MEKEKPTVSVVLPTYNRAQLIEKSIRSVLDQTLSNLELIVVDDGSTDNTKEVVENIGDDRVVYLHYFKNKGANFARNLGIKTAKADYIAFQDSDDEWYTDKLEKQVKRMKESASAGVVYSGYIRIEDTIETYVPDEGIKQLEGNVLPELLKHNFVGTPVMLIKKECFEKVGVFDEKLPRFQDWELSIRLAKQYKFSYISEATMNAYIQTNSITQNKEAQRVAFKMIFDKHYNEFSKDKPLFIKNHIIVGVQAYLGGNINDARHYLKKAYSMDRLNLKILLRYATTFLSPEVYKNMRKLYQSILSKKGD